jgi:diguanylate cyclase (GGDEF)-like protein
LNSKKRPRSFSDSKLKTASEDKAFHLRDVSMSGAAAVKRIFELTAAMAQHTDVKMICEALTDWMLGYFEGIGGVALLVKNEAGELQEVASRSRNHGSVSYKRSIVDRVLGEAKAVVTTDGNSAGESLHSDADGMERVVSVACLPLVSRSAIHGVMVVHALDGERVFEKEDLKLLEGMVGPAALAIENALVHARVGRVEKALKNARHEFEKEVEKRTAELVEVNRRLKELSVTDGLTGLYNHRHLVHMLESEYRRAARYKRRFAFLMLDIDYFKEVNDNFGHPCGDAVLQAIGQILKKSVRVTDLVARYGGDEMAVILLETSLKMAMRVAEKLRRQIEEHPFSWEGTSFRVTVSIGAAGAPEEGIEDWNDLLNAADHVLYQAKDRGRNTVLAFQPDGEATPSLSDSQLKLFSKRKTETDA